MFFGLFKRHPSQPIQPAPSTASTAAQQILDFMRRAPIGTELSYLGRTLVVTGPYTDLQFGFSTRLSACISADYVDDNGVIHQIRFGTAECEALLEANGR